MINKLFRNSTIKILIYEIPSTELNVLTTEINDPELEEESIVGHNADLQETAHSDDESPVSGIEFSDNIKLYFN